MIIKDGKQHFKSGWIEKYHTSPLMWFTTPLVYWLTGGVCKLPGKLLQFWLGIVQTVSLHMLMGGVSQQLMQGQDVTRDLREGETVCTAWTTTFENSTFNHFVMMSTLSYSLKSKFKKDFSTFRWMHFTECRSSPLSLMASNRWLLSWSWGLSGFVSAWMLAFEIRKQSI